MSTLKNIERLVLSTDQQNVKLGLNLIEAQVNPDNVIAFTLMVKSVEGINEESNLVQKLIGIIESRNPVKQDPKRLSDYTIKDLLQSAIMSFDSDENIDYAREVYINYINQLCDKAKATSSLKGDKDDQRGPTDK